MGRSPCCDKKGLKKGPWTPEEDEKLVRYIHAHGPGNWRSLPKNAGLQRCGKSSRLRWTNYLRPDIKRGRFSFEEEESIIQLHSILGNKWSAIAARLPGRTDNEIKNYWNTHIRKRLLKMGIDPVTHSPRLDLLELSSILNSNQLNLSNLLGLQTVLNPELTRILASLVPLNHQKPEMLLQKLKQNQLMMNIQMQNNSSPKVQPSPQSTSSNFPMAPLIHQTQGMDMMSCQSFQQNLVSSSLDGCFGNLPNSFSNVSDQIKSNLSENSDFPSTDNSQITNQNFTFDSILSTPMSSPTPLNSPPAFISNSATEDERESYFNDLFKFEIPESLDLDNFM